MAGLLRSFVIKGANSDDKELTGRLSFLDDRGGTLSTFTLSHLGLFKLSPEKVEAGAESARVKAELYCEDVRFEYGSAWA